jgi:hypothetical protein
VFLAAVSAAFSAEYAGSSRQPELFCESAALESKVIPKRIPQDPLTHFLNIESPLTLSIDLNPDQHPAEILIIHGPRPERRLVLILHRWIRFNRVPPVIFWAVSFAGTGDKGKSA